MESNQEKLNQISQIKDLMEKSSRFLSLSGLSGIFAGIFALLGATAVYLKFSYHFKTRYIENGVFSFDDLISGNDYQHFIVFSLIVGIAMLILALGFGWFFSYRKAKREGLAMWNATSRRMFVNLFIPLAAGGIFCLILLHHGIIFLIAPATLLFYGLALLNASKYTLRDVRYLGISEIILGLVASWFVGYGLVFWAVGFGVLHILYGAIMYFKYEKNQ